MSVLVIVMSMYFLHTYIYLKKHPERRYELQVLSEEEQQLSSSELNHCHIDTRGVSVPPGNCQPCHSAVSVLANEHSFKSQLRATAFTLFLFLATWALGAMAVSLGHFLDMIFSCLYGAFCVTLGLYLLIQHCAKRDDVWHHWWACCLFKSKTGVKNGDRQNQKQGFQPHCHQNSSCSGKQQFVSPYLMQSPKITPPPQNPTPTHTDSCCMAVMSPSSTSLILSHINSPCPQSLPDGLPFPTPPLQSCLTERTKSSSFNLPRLCLHNYNSHMNSTSMDGSVHSSHMDSTHSMHKCEDLPLVPNSPHPDLQVSCLTPPLDNQLASCHSLQRQTSCQSIQESITSCQSHGHNMHDSITSCHSLLLPSHVVHTCQWHVCNSANHSSCEKPDAFTIQHQKECATYICKTKTADKEKENHYLEVEQKCFPRNTLPRQHATVSRRGPIGRNSSLQENALFGSDATGNIWTGRWRNETPV